MGPVSSIFLAGLDTDTHGWMGHAVALSNIVAGGMPGVTKWGTWAPGPAQYRDEASRYFKLHVQRTGYGRVRR
jgi:hypothetical protein